MIKNKRNLLFLSIVFLFSIDSDADKNLESLMSVLYSQTCLLYTSDAADE